LLHEGSRVYQDSNSQSESSLGSVRLHSFTLSCTLGSIRCASRYSLLARTLASPCLGHEPKVRVAKKVVFIEERKTRRGLTYFKKQLEGLPSTSFMPPCMPQF